HDWLLRQRWFRGKARELVALELADHAYLAAGNGSRLLLATVRVRYTEGDPEEYLLPLSFRPPPGEEADAVPLLTFLGETGEIRLYEALLDKHTSTMLLEAVEQERAVQSSYGSYQGLRTNVLEEISGSRNPVRRVESEQSNTSIIFGDQLILKVFRKLEKGLNPDLEVTRFLTEQTDFSSLPRLAGWIEHESDDGSRSAVAGLFEYVVNKGEAWSYTLRALNRYFAAASRSAADPTTTSGREATRRMAGDYLASARRLGGVTGELHAALASADSSHPDFVAEPIGTDEVSQWVQDFQKNAAVSLREVGQRLEAIPGLFPAAILNDIAAVVRDAPSILARMGDLQILQDAGARRIRFHGDYHLGQLIRRAEARPGGGDEWVILDFEGEPARPLAVRREKHSPLRDVAGMMRSFNYSVRMALAEQEVESDLVRSSLEAWAEAWEREVRSLFLQGYREAVAGTNLIPEEEEILMQVLSVFELEKAIYELGYEMNNRPDWIWVPVQGIRGIMEKRA
nr:hypothetical protein [Gemmatimonadota bacterium]